MASESVGERVYTIPLRKDLLKAPKDMKTTRAVNCIRHFVTRHMKVDDVRLSPRLNDLLWARGISGPPSRVKVKVSGTREFVTVRLPEEIVMEKKEEEKAAKSGIMQKVGGLKTGIVKQPRKGAGEAKKPETTRPSVETASTEKPKQ